MRLQAGWVWLCAAPLLGGAEVRLNQAQVIGTHNSYHLSPPAALTQTLNAFSQGAAAALAYSHRPLAEQFSMLGIRQIELDLYADPQGGRFAEPKGRAFEASPDRATARPHDPEGALRRPGFKVLHVPDVDYRTTVLTFQEALQQVRGWSEKHPRHFPILILLELGTESPSAALTPPVPIGPAEFEALEVEILSVFKRERVLAPDDARGGFKTLRDAVRQRGWPTLDAARGKVMFALDNGGPLRDLYLRDHPGLERRLLFVSVDETHPAAAWFKINDPVGGFDRIQRLVRAGFLVRTRADADLVQARQNDTRQRDRALASGAQFISTDFPEPDPKLSGYHVRFSRGIVARTNPVNGDPTLNGVELEALKAQPVEGPAVSSQPEGTAGRSAQ